MEEVIQREKDLVYRLAFSQCHQKDQADDIFQNVMYRYMKRKPVFESLEHEKAWFIRAHGQRVELTRNECRILQLLLEHKGEIVSRDALMTRLWESDSFVDENTLTVNIARLRRKLEAAGLPDFIRTRKGAGYLVEG